MAGEREYLDKAGLATLWERIQQLVYECSRKHIVRYRLECHGDVVTLVGSDGSRSTVSVGATIQCDE